MDMVSGLKQSPSAVTYGDNIYVFHQDSDQRGILAFDGFAPNGDRFGDKQVSGPACMSCSPSAVFYDSKVWVFYQGPGNDGTLRYNIFDGKGWQGEQRVPGAGISESPSAVEYDNRLFVFYQGQGNSGAMWYSEFKAQSKGGQGVWSGTSQVPGLQMSASPAAVTFNNMIYIFHQGGGNRGDLWLVTYNGRFAADDVVYDVSLSNSPGVVAVPNTKEILCFVKGQGGSDYLWLKEIPAISNS